MFDIGIAHPYTINFNGKQKTIPRRAQPFHSISGGERAADPLTLTTPYPHATSVLDSSILSRHALIKFWIAACKSPLSELFYDEYFTPRPRCSHKRMPICKSVNEAFRFIYNLHISF